MRRHYDARTPFGRWQAEQDVLDELSRDILDDNRPELTDERLAIHLEFKHHPTQCLCWERAEYLV